MTKYIEIWGELIKNEKTYKIGVKLNNGIENFPEDIKISNIWTIGALKYYMNQVVNYCIENGIKITVYSELRVV